MTDQTAELTETAAASPAARRRKPMARAVYGDIVQIVEFALVVFLALAIAFVYHNEVLIVDFDAERYTSAGIIGATCFTALLRRDGFYDFERMISATRALRPVLTMWLLTVLALIAFGFTLKVSDAFSRIWLYTWTGLTAVTVAGVRIGAAAYLKRAAREGGVFARRIAVVGAGEAARAYVAALSRSANGVAVAGVFTSDALGAGPLDADGGIKDLERRARDGEIDDIVIAAPSAAPAAMQEVVTRLSALPVSVSLLANIHWLDHQGGELTRIAGAPALSLYRRPLEGWGGLIKTIEDRLLGLVFFLIAAPVMLACAIALKLQRAGPVLFVQQRHGFNNEVFRIYKFRTMRVAEDGGRVVQATAGDPRTTPVGRFLRKWSLDELPQLINVLKGEMSLVGPRPHALAHNDAYAKVIENYSGRHKVKPGITGWAQVNGYRGETSETEQMAERVRYDLEYIDNWSLVFDLKILAMTVVAVLFPRNAH